jgi:hypothetical protein
MTDGAIIGQVEPGYDGRPESYSTHGVMTRTSAVFSDRML